MTLPVRIVGTAPSDPVVSVDGASESPGLNLSHWPGNRTPEGLRHDLSTGSALAFVRLPAAERAALTEGCREVVNNHFDTDGTCALWVVAHPERAASLEAELLAAAAAGDFFEVPDERAFLADCCIRNSADPERSFLEGLGAHEDLARWQLATDHWMEHLEPLLSGGHADYRDLWEPELARLRDDLGVLERASRHEVAGRAFTTWRADSPTGRHALFERSGTDRVLACAPEGRGTSFRFLIGTRSWFDLVSPSPPPRPDLDALVRRLNELEGSRVDEGFAWHAQPTESPSPELWFGRPGLAFFQEHNDRLGPSSLAPEVVAACVADALQASAG